ncbi:uncharacterized protein LOC129634267 isoform X2 [Bubalus kerabau]|uniref:uncharacterized protein LOC129634267 isoform X2 n=1 Tax=Bubalus carabanensis TaxID=3119969 RepID=UPI00244E9BB2|nr:uncharacterized protein LOC129634267 isoform X2 [Bubalus carabanensis]
MDLRKGDPQENISARKDLLTKFNGCSSDICINEGEKKKDPSLMEKEYPWVVKGLKAHTRQVGRLWLEPREPECTGTLTTADCLWLSCSSLWPQGDRHSFTLITYPPPVWLWSMSTQAGAPTHILASLVAQLVKNSPAMQETWFDHWVGKIPWRREWLRTPIFWPREFHGLYSSWGCQELDTTEWLPLSFNAQIYCPSSAG